MYYFLLSMLFVNLAFAQERMKPEETEVWEPEPRLVFPGVLNSPPSDAEILFDGTNYVHFDCDKNKNVIDFFRYGRNDETYILETLEKNFDVSMIDEHDEDYQDLQSDDTNVITIKLEEN